MNSPKSKEGCYVTERQSKLLWGSLYYISRLKLRKTPKLKTYCMIKRLVLYAAK
jgi:hypothetical protein